LAKTLIGLVAAVLVVTVVLTLYATGPSRKASHTGCAATTPTTLVGLCIVDSTGKQAWFARRTNAWERFKGAITGKP
jgi:hypothetical protein